MTRRNQPEAALQRSVIQHLTWRARPGVLVFHVPLGGLRSQIEGAILAASAQSRGTPDFSCIVRRQAHFALELKARAAASPRFNAWCTSGCAPPARKSP